MLPKTYQLLVFRENIVFGKNVGFWWKHGSQKKPKVQLFYFSTSLFFYFATFLFFYFSTFLGGKKKMA